MADEAEDEREEELSTISAIFPELVIDPANSFSASLEIPVAPAIPIKVRFPPLVDGSINLLPPGDNDGAGLDILAREDVHLLNYLPSIQLQLGLPKGYPENEPPIVKLTTALNWLPAVTLEQLQEQAAILWDEYGHLQVVFAYIDYIQQAAEHGFDCGNGTLDIDQALKIPLLDFDIKTKRQKFEQETFDCGICLEPKKGSSCYRLQKCSHVFCVDCLQDFYVNAITEGDVANVKCLAPDCGVQRDNNTRRAKKAARTLGPNELLQIPIERSLVQRYVDLKRKKKLESSKDTVYCPRQWCQGPASVKRRIKKDLSQFEDEESADESEVPPVDDEKKKAEDKVVAINDRLRICEDCDYAFCRVCLTGWHGEFVRCWPKSTTELNEVDQASYDYIRLHTSPCPTCSSPSQKTHGCNHMNCYQCNTHFCYLCSAWLDPQNPYKHFNDKKIGCYQRLWELEEGDDGNGNVRFEGARGWEAAAAAADAADEAERLQQQAPNADVGAVVAPPPEVVIPAPDPGEIVDMDVPDVHALLHMDEAQIRQVINNMPEEAAEQFIVDLLAAAGIEEEPPAHGQPGWRVPGLAQRAPGGDDGARRMNDGHAARGEVAALGQQNYIRQVRGEDWVEPLMEPGDDEIDEMGGDGLADPVAAVEEPALFVIVPPRGRGGRNARGRERGRGS
ncbi:putative ring finger protein [Venturia nashicola]|nr:putative ring finger protein [Venturia nashicola]